MQTVILRLWAATALAVALGAGGCARTVRTVQVAPGPPATLAELWQDPGDFTSRDLLHGAGGVENVPRGPRFRFVAADTSGYSPGFDVEDERGIAWSVKTGPEAQTEVVASRVLWALGFHQPPTYYLAEWELTGAQHGPQEAGRFRPDLPGHTVVGEWPWHENPFVGSREFGGLVVANLLIANWDWKTSNNKIYEIARPAGGVSRRFVVRDIGASFGRFTYPRLLTWFRLRGFGQGTRNDLPGFERQGFIKHVDLDRSRVEFDYRGIYRDVIAGVTPADVRWACERLSRLTDRQWHDAFGAGGYPAGQAARYVARIKQKIEQGLRMTSRAG